MGFDVANFELDSVIYQHLLLAGDSAPAEQKPLFRLARLHFAPRLNSYGMFTDFADGVLLRDVVHAQELLARASFVPEWGDLFVLALSAVGPDDIGG